MSRSWRGSRLSCKSIAILRLTWEPEAEEQFAAVITHIGAVHLAAAERLKRVLLESIDRVCRFPASGRPGRVDGTRELIAHPNYLVIYRVTADAIEILRILHARQRYP